ncbi:MAG: hypothetical protein AAFU64_20520, partial [Bacteroidota bacterium]
SVLFELIRDTTILYETTENVFPYAFFGDNGEADYKSGSFLVGKYTLRATPYALARRQGEVGIPLEINFEVRAGNDPEGQWRFVWQDPLLRNSVRFDIVGVRDDFRTVFDSGVDQAGNIYVSGGVFRIFDSGSSPSEAYLRKYNPNGILLWDRMVKAPNRDGNTLFGFAADPNGNTYITVSNAEFANNQSVLMKHNSEGELEWFRSELDNTFFGLDIDADGFINVTTDNGQGFSLLRYDSNGNLILKRGLPNQTRHIKAGLDGSLFVTTSVVSNQNKASVLKYAKDLSLLWSISPRINRSGRLIIGDIAPDADGGVLISGQFRGELTLDPGANRNVFSSPDQTK